MKIKLSLNFLLLSIIALFSFSCTTIRDYSEVYEELDAANYDIAYEQLEEKKDQIYTEKDELLYSLDSGLLAHYNKDYDESNKKLSHAERLIEFFYAKSISQGVLSFFSNDNVQDYSGEEYEDIYSNLFMALNYIHLGETEDAFVEIRRFDNKQKSLSVKYSEEIAYAKSQTDGALDATIQFNNSALARYVSLILYRSINQFDSAEVDRKKIAEAFQTQTALYPFEIPLAVDEEFYIPRDMARLNIISFVGLAPVKIEQRIEPFSISSDIFFTIALPEMLKRGTKVDAISVSIFGEDNSSYLESMEKIESIENIAFDTFRQNKALIYSKSFIRSISKSVVSSSLDFIAEQNEDSGLELLAVASKIWNVATEFADLRTSQFFPAEAYVGGVNLPEGIYLIQVKYLDKHGRKLYEEVFEKVEVSKNKLNLVETLCVK